jgi:hypothetical protein
MNLAERLKHDKRLSFSTRMIAAEILRQIDPLTGRARITAEQLADTLDCCCRDRKESHECAYQP